MMDIQSLSREKYDIASKIRDIYLITDPGLYEDIKYGGVAFFKDEVLVGGIYFYKAHISIEFSQGALLSDPHFVLEGKGKFRRHMKIRSMGDIDIKNVPLYVQETLAN